MTKRNYSYKNVNMLMAAKTITKSFKTYQPELITIRTNWTEEYATDLDSRIDTATEDYLGLDQQKELRAATTYLTNIQQPAMQSLALLKIQIEVDFGKDASEILNSLGYTKNFRAVQRGDQESLIELLFAFKKGMTPALKNRITDKGTNPTLIDTIINYATEMQQANITQESLKQSTQQITEEAQLVFNGIYTEVMGICKIASKFYKNDPLRKDQFTFSKVVRNMGVATKKEIQEEIPAND